MPKQKHKVRFTMTLNENGTISSTMSKAPDKTASVSDVEEFVSEAKKRLDDFLAHCQKSKKEA